MKTGKSIFSSMINLGMTILCHGLQMCLNTADIFIHQQDRRFTFVSARFTRSFPISAAWSSIRASFSFNSLIFAIIFSSACFAPRCDSWRAWIWSSAWSIFLLERSFQASNSDLILFASKEDEFYFRWLRKIHSTI